MNNARLNFLNGDTVGVVRCISISILDDTKVENDEYFHFTITNGHGTQFNETSTRIYILEDDGMTNVLLNVATIIDQIIICYLYTVAEIGMVEPIAMVTEAETSISLCAVLINFVELEIPLTAFIQTQAITATGWFDV